MSSDRAVVFLLLICILQASAQGPAPANSTESYSPPDSCATSSSSNETVPCGTEGICVRNYIWPSGNWTGGCYDATSFKEVGQFCSAMPEDTGFKFDNKGNVYSCCAVASCANFTMDTVETLMKFKEDYCNASLCNSKYSDPMSIQCESKSMQSDVICQPFLKMCVPAPMEPCAAVERNNTLLSRLCHGNDVGNMRCDAYCMTKDAFFDDGDCNNDGSRVSIFRAFDENRDGVVTKAEAMSRAWLIANYTTVVEEKKTIWDFARMLQDCDHITFQKFLWYTYLNPAPPVLQGDYHPEYLALHILKVGDINEDNELQPNELMTVYNLTDMEVMLLEKSNGNETGIYMDNVAHIIQSIYSGLDGDDWEMEYGYPLPLAISAFVKFLDFNGDGMISLNFEASYAMLSMSVIEQMDLDGNMMLSPAEILQAVKLAAKNPCNGVEVVTELSAMHLVSTFLPKKCMYIVQPNWFSPLPPPPVEQPPTCQVYTAPLRSLSESFQSAASLHQAVAASTAMRRRRPSSSNLLVKAQKYGRYHMADRKKYAHMVEQMPRARSAVAYPKYSANRKLLQFADNTTTSEMYDFLVFLPMQSCDFGSFVSTTLGNVTNPFSRTRPLTPEAIPQIIFDKLDVNDDGVLTVEETICLQHSVFDMIAGPGSSNITVEEMSNYMNTNISSVLFRDFYMVHQILGNGSTFTPESLAAETDGAVQSWVQDLYQQLMGMPLLVYNFTGHENFFPKFQDYLDSGVWIPQGQTYPGACVGSLIASDWVLTSASCVNEQKTLDQVSMIDRNTSQVVYRGVKMMSVHPGADYSIEFDVAVIQLTSSFDFGRPVHLYDGGDLRYDTCHALALQVADEMGKTLRPVRQVQNEACYHNFWMNGEEKRVASPSILCTENAHLTLGSPVVTNVGGMKVQVGVTTTQLQDLPTTSVRVSSVLQWILSHKGLGRHPAGALNLNLLSFDLLPGAVLNFFQGNNRQAKKTVLDSNCDQPLALDDMNSGTIVAEFDGSCPECFMTGFEVKLGYLSCQDAKMQLGYCPADCLATLPVVNFSDPYMTAPPLPDCQNPLCTTNLTWAQVTELSRIGKAYTGGLGPMAVRTYYVNYGVWICVRDWNADEMNNCGIKHKQLACFRFEENSREFHFDGVNEVVKYVPMQNYMMGLDTEASLMKVLPNDLLPFKPSM
ncbi:hypothetical protein GUITHDRAFT_122697 [Guillardia theta CCMP2712]|uniref:Peptidase S1 domain-containing protein n=1 Tax=Guillardia theta (strain CCMP2712) TaxID=905079 RepID=L1I4A1_GUITC|nr:hypothetical protein GUITHDRAFT_122697 [Guillardia theta CCMP2712]EKX31098.1 hypothetical protein GUITHDRAFT_122697 [Guillardia theta CCMP2712]|eukprot:XP_005818078.1 hypothetical protein GUITHDRAFT_122697 [Guillardia theta CCMP2712]